MVVKTELCAFSEYRCVPRRPPARGRARASPSRRTSPCAPRLTPWRPPRPPPRPLLARSVYPGKGSRFVTRGGQLVVLAGSKVDSLYHQRKKPAKLVWTQAWRRMHKKLNVEAAAKKRGRRVVKLAHRGFVGMDAAKVAQTKRPVGAAPAKVAAAKGAPKVVVQQATIKEAKEKAKAAALEKKKASGRERA